MGGWIDQNEGPTTTTIAERLWVLFRVSEDCSKVGILEPHRVANSRSFIGRTGSRVAVEVVADEIRHTVSVVR